MTKIKINKLIIACVGIGMASILTMSLIQMRPEPEQRQPEPIEEKQGRFYEQTHFIIDIIEQTHPIFKMADKLNQAEYITVREEFIKNGTAVENERDFFFELLHYIKVLQDGHMVANNMWWMNNSTIAEQMHVTEQGVFLVDTQGNHAGKVISIAEIEIEKILETIAEYIYFENEIDKGVWLQKMVGKQLIHERIIGHKLETQIEIIVEVDGQIEIRESEYMIIRDEPYRYNTGAKMNHQRLAGDIFYMDIPVFTNEVAFKEMEIEVVHAIEEGIKKFIIDLRDNPGGNSGLGTDLLAAMGISMSGASVKRRVSELFLEEKISHYFGNPKSEEALNFIEEIRTLYFDELWVSSSGELNGTNENDLQIVILMNNNTYSSAQMIANMVQDTGVGLLVGEPSREAPSSFGDMMYVRVPKTDWQLALSSSWFGRTDERADSMLLMPDVLVPSEQALEVAIDYLLNK